MQTFLPFPDFALSAARLDGKRLGKQRVEALTILRVLGGTVRGWRNHPAVRMWEGHEPALCLYGVRCCDEWRGRGFRDSCRLMFAGFLAGAAGVRLPGWFGDERFHASHRSNLKRKDPVHYAAFSEPPDLPYFWPTKERPFSEIFEKSGICPLQGK